MKEKLRRIQSNLKPLLSADSIIPKIIAVSKKQSIKKIEELHELGIRDFGENYLQESLEKQMQLKKQPNNKNINWHYLGKLQSKKIAKIIDMFSVIHSVCSTDDLKKIAKICQTKSSIQKVMLQVNLDKSPTKSGFEPIEIISTLIELDEIKGVEIIGLMFFPDIKLNEKATAQYFNEAQLFFKKSQNLLNKKYFCELSMGTSHDYEIAAKYGATYLRLGTVLMGERI